MTCAATHAIPRLPCRFWLVLACVLHLCCGSGCGSGNGSEPPNIVLISLDTVRVDHLGTFGYARDTDPALARFAARGAAFERAYAQSPSTVPTHASLFTGRFPYEHGTHAFRQALPAGEVTLAEYLAEHGYRTFAIASSVRFDVSAGFDQGFEFYRSLQDLDKNDRSRTLVDLAIERADATCEEPVFAFLHLFDAHAPYAPPSPYRERWHKGAAPLDPDETVALLRRHQRQDLPLDADKLEHLIDLYDGAISFQDHWLGRLIERWESLACDRPTLWVITSDHGEEFMDHQHLSHAHSLYEELLRVPLVVVYPERVAPDQHIEESIQTVDLFRTIVDLAGLPMPPQVRGRSFAGRLVDGSKPEPFGEGIESLVVTERIDRFGFIGEFPEGRFKWISGSGELLFDLTRDPKETRNAARRNAVILETLSSMPERLRLPDPAELMAEFEQSKLDHARAEAERAQQAAGAAGTQAPMPSEEMAERLRAIGYGAEVGDGDPEP